MQLILIHDIRPVREALRLALEDEFINDHWLLDWTEHDLLLAVVKAELSMAYGVDYLGRTDLSTLRVKNILSTLPRWVVRRVGRLRISHHAAGCVCDFSIKGDDLYITVAQPHNAGEHRPHVHLPPL